MPAVRNYRPDDEEHVVELSLRAWEPVFEALKQALGAELFLRLRGDWRAGQAAQVRSVLSDSAQRVWVADGAAGRAVGWVAARLHPDEELGEIYMIAVDPAAQGQGIGAGLTSVATEWLRRSGMRVAMVETGGDPGHAPARRLYENSGYTPLPAVRFFKAL
ncbi:MAG TPA: GNAT family N-acetyltransferase [Solirubrobacteraceae bacterium]|nr:GNAT family N-acetyltransferase [Solirubrobacteraceae bacterium]